MQDKDKKFKELLQAEHAKALAELVKLKSFRFYAAELLGFCKTFDNAFSEKGNVASYNNGLQAVGQKIFKDIMATDPETYLKLCKEEAEYLSLQDTMRAKEEANAQH